MLRYENLIGLDSDNSIAIVNRLTGGKTLPDELLQQIIFKTDGIPLFVEDLTKTVLESGILQEQADGYILDGPLPPLAVPSTLHDSLVARLDRLAAIKEIAQLGAVIGRQFSYTLIAAAAKVDDGNLSNALTQLVDAELLFRRGTPPNSTYTFKHALLQDAAYNSLLSSKRQLLHAHIVRALEQQFSDIVETEPELLAHHCVGAGFNQKAIEYWRNASKHAIQNSAYTEAMAHLNKGLDLLQQLPAERERDRLELGLQTARAMVYQATKGFSAQETGAAYARARELCDQLDDAAEVFPTLHGIYLFHGLRAEHELSSEIATECLQRAQQQQDSLLLTIAHRVIGSMFLVLGNFTSARDHIEQVMTLYDPEQHRQAVFTYGVDPKSIGLAHAGQILFSLGYLDQSLAASEQAIAHSDQLKHGYNLGYALFWYNVVGIQRGNAVAVSKRAQRLISLGTEQGFPTWIVFGTFQHGVALAQLGKLEQGIKQMRRGLDEYLTLEIDLFRPNKLAALALALAEAGELEQALELLNEAMATVQRTKECWFEAELYRIKGKLLRLKNTAEAIEEAEICLLTALDIGRQQQAKFWQLRAANELAILWREQNQRQQAKELLTPIYQWFSEGFDSPDLKQAGALVEELNQSSSRKNQA